jgi:hypothetical protein
MKMSTDMTKCNGDNCLIKDKCRRFTTPTVEEYQSWFLKPPFTIVKNIFKCDMFWGDNADMIMEQLKSIVSKKVIKKNKK